MEACKREALAGMPLMTREKNRLKNFKFTSQFFRFRLLFNRASWFSDNKHVRNLLPPRLLFFSIVKAMYNARLPEIAEKIQIAFVKFEFGMFFFFINVIPIQMFKNIVLNQKL